MIRKRISRVVIHALMVLLSGTGIGQNLPLFDGPPARLDADSWRLTWSSETGASYRLERSFDLLVWEPVDTITAFGPLTTLNDDSPSASGQVFWRVVRLDGPGGINPLQITDVSPAPGNPDHWQLTWTSRSGVTYILERSFDLEAWEEVGTISAISDLTTLLDTRVPGQPKVFWRVKVFGSGGEPLVIGDVSVEYHVNGANSSVTYRVVAGGTETVAGVRILDNGTALGDARQGFGDTWALTLDWDPASPQAHRITAEVTTEEGRVEESALRGGLLADPEFFVPVDATGALRQGELVEVAEDGSLGSFRFYPEGTGDPGRDSGVHFEFPGGARLDPVGGAMRIAFSEGRFFRGPADPSPVLVQGGSRFLDVDDVSAAAVRAGFSLPPGPIELPWGNGSVSWESGSLGREGWASLQIDLPIGDFDLPAGRLDASVSVDPESGELFLVVCYYGDWSPGSGGPLFRIPQADPLKIYYSQSGDLAAHGTVEAEFPSGSRVRGSISWQHPNFEFRFEGQGIVIPALDTLKGILPSDPLACAPSGTSSAELNAFAECLQGYRSTFRGLSTGGATQAVTAPSPSPDPLPRPTDQVGAALDAWMGRLVSWQGDRAGQALSDAQLADLTGVIRQAGRTGEGAHDLSTVLKLLRSALLMAGPLEAVRGSGPLADTLAGATADAERRLFASAMRIAAGPGLTEVTPETQTTADLLREIDAIIVELDPPPSPAPDGSIPEGGGSFRRFSYDRLSSTYRNGVDRGIFADRDIQPGDFGGGDNSVLNAMDEEGLLAFLAEVLGVLNVLRADDRGLLHVSQVSGGPQTPPLHEAWRQVQDVFELKHTTASLAALQSNDFNRIRRALAIRARYFELHFALGEYLASNDDELRPLTALLADAYLVEQAKRPGSVLAATCGSDIATFDRILRNTTDMGDHDELRAKVDQAAACRDLLAHNNGAQTECDAVYLTLLGEGLQVANPLPAKDTPRTVRLTGRYEDVGSGGAPLTLQINQGGRLLLGRTQTHQIRPGLSNRSTFTKRLIGMLKSEGPNQAEFYVLLREDDGSFLGRRTDTKHLLVATKTTGGVDLELKPLPGAPGQAIPYLKTTEFPAFSPLFTDLFEGEAREIFLAQQGAPLHSRQIAAVRGHFGTVLAGIINYLAADATGRIAEAQNIGRDLKNVAEEVSTTQIPLARQILREMLSRTSEEADGARLSHWNWLRVIFSRHNNSSPVFDEFRAFMGPEINTQFSGNAFKYAVRITDVSAGANVGIAGLGIGRIGIELTKTRADGTGGSEEIILTGGMGQGGAGWTPKRLDDLNEFGGGGGGGGASFEVFSDIDYSEASLAGPLMLIGASAGIGIGVADVSVGPSILILYGDLSLPPFALPLPIVNMDNNIRFPSLEMNFGLGAVRGDSPIPANSFSLTAEPADQSFTAASGIVGAVHFDVGSHQLRACGFAELRTLVAEMRTIFESETATISILGFTDATGIPGNTPAQDDAYNDTLSQDRANAVKAALVTLTGEGLRVPEARIRAIGLGRRPSMGLTSPKETELNSAETEFLTRKKQNSPILVDGQASQEWRTVTILLNNLVSIDLGSEGTGAGQQP